MNNYEIQFTDILRTCGFECKATPKQLAKNFFREWFSESSSRYFFLFRKNLAVTNIQFAELISLIKSQLKDISNFIHFYTYQDFIREFSRLIETFCDKRDVESLEDEVISLITKIYIEHLNNTIIIDPLYGSCGVYVPKNLQLNLDRICVESGYIQSAGKLIMLQYVDNYNEEEFIKQIQMHLRNNPTELKRPFVIYSHEDFYVSTIQEAKTQKNGLEDLKLHINKFYIGSKRMTSVLKKLDAKFKKELRVYLPGELSYYKENRRELILREDSVDREKTIWLLVDSEINYNGRKQVVASRSDSRYFICYEQIITSRNPFHIFGEEKPGWIAPVTISPTLACAMINIFRPNLQDKSIGYDPFCGSGTFLLEVLKLPAIEMSGSDIEKISEIVIKDNKEIISFNAIEIETLTGKIQESYGSLLKEFKDIFFNEENKHEESEETITKKIISKIFDSPLELRVLYYCALKANFGIIPGPSKNEDRGSLSHEESSLKMKNIRRVVSDLIDKFNELKKLIVDREDSGNEDDGFIKYNNDTDFSTVVTCSLDKYRNKKININSGIEFNIYNFDKEKKYDFIVTDPPYGLNEEMEFEELFKLYSEGIKRMIKSLKKNSHLVFCVPMKSRVGRKIPYFINPKFITRMVFRAASEEGREVIGHTSLIPGAFGEVIHAPYYWESSKALRRAILHFRIF